MNTWRVALRVARRSVRRHLGRSLLIIALIALPVAGLTVVDGLVRTMTDRDVEVDRVMGTADARITTSHRGPLPDLTALEDALPEGSRAVPLGAAYFTGSLRLTDGDRTVRTRLDMVALGDPLTAHLARLTSGRLPKNPAETLVTEPLAARLGMLDGDGNLRPDSTLRVSGGGPVVTVTGLAVKPYCLRCADVVGRPDSLLKNVMLDGLPLPLGYLIDLPDGADSAALFKSLSGTDWTILTRDVYQDTTPFGGYVQAAAGEPVTLFAGLGLLAIVILAGAAFAVGARRQVRELGLVVVNGGTAKHVRRVVLAQGLVLGVVGAGTGLIVGGAAAVLGVPLWERLTGQLIENLRFGWAELAGAALVGVLASVAAATLPAISVGRMDPVDALAGRFRAGKPRARLPLFGLFLVLAGLSAVLFAAVVAASRVTENQGLLERYNYAPPLDQTMPVTVTLAGAAVTVLGLVLVMPALTAAVGRLGSRLPLSGRLAVREALRHRQRTVAAGAAIMVTVASSIVAAFVFAARVDSEPRTLPDNTALVQLDGIGRNLDVATGGHQLEQTRTKLDAAVPGVMTSEVIYVSGYPDDPHSASILLAPQNAAPCWGSSARLGIATPELITLSTGREPDVRVWSALDEGKVVVFADCLTSRNSMVTLSYNLPTRTEMPAYIAAPAPGTDSYQDNLPRAFISAETAAAHGWGPITDSVAVVYSTRDDLDAVRVAAEDAGMDLYVGESAGMEVTSLYLVLAAMAGLVALLGAGVTVALSATDGRADLATLAALGAPPRRRRTFAGAHALVVTALGTLAGLALGVCTGYAAVPVAGLPVHSVPWQHLWLTTLAVPLLAAAVAALATPSRLPMVRRQES